MIDGEKRSLAYLGINSNRAVHWNISAFDLISNSILDHQCELTSSGALACNTGKFTGRSPKDKYIVANELTQNNIWLNQDPYSTWMIKVLVSIPEEKKSLLTAGSL